MTVKEIDKFRDKLQNTEEVDERSEYYKSQAIHYLGLYCDFVEDRGKKRIKQKGENNEKSHITRRSAPGL